MPPPIKSYWQQFEEGPLLGLATILFLSATSLMLVEAFSRGFLNHSYFFAEELVRFLVIWAFFMTIGIAGRRGSHIRSEILIMFLPKRVQIAAQAFTGLSAIAFGLILLVGAWPQLIRFYDTRMMSESTLNAPMWLVFVALPLGAVMMVIWGMSMLKCIRDGRDPFGGDAHGSF